jgi:acetyltransferase-like isoleucine patch superfamily enzyme
MRYLYYKKKLRNLGAGCIIDQGVIIKKPETISIGDNVWIDKNVIILGGEGIEIGRRVHIAQNCMIQGEGTVKIGNYVGIAANSMIFSATDTIHGGKRIGPMVPPKYRNPVSKKPVNIEKDAFIGAGCIVLPGVRIGEGATVGAGSVVTKDIPPWKVAVGCPAKPIKDRPQIILPDF